MLNSNIKNAREKAKISQRELGRRIGKTGQYISYLEKNIKINPSIDTLNKIAIALEVSLNDLFDSDRLILDESLDLYLEVEEDLKFNNPDVLKVVSFLESFHFKIRAKSYNDTTLINIFKNDNILTTIEKSDFEEYALPLIAFVDLAKNKANGFIEEIDLLYGFHTKNN